MDAGWQVTVIDVLDPFYPKELKLANIQRHRSDPRFAFLEGDILDPAVLEKAHTDHGPFEVVVHLAAKAGVRPSIADPMGYHRVNVTGTLSLFEAARSWGVPHVVLASSSSVYGEDPEVPWSENGCKERPISPYAATKLLAESYARLYSSCFGMRITTLRFFTVYGPRQRPDLAIHRFVRNISNNVPIVRFGDGSTRRDYTYIADIINGLVGAIDRKAGGPFEVYNLGNSRTVALNELIEAIGTAMGSEAVIDQQPEQQGDVPQTFADVSKAGRDLGFAPSMPLEEGLREFVKWYRQQRSFGLLS
jgi:UDP-glucuronate 4-epimerase